MDFFIMKKYFNRYRVVVIAVAIGFIPLAGFCQEADEQLVQDLPQVERGGADAGSSILSTSPWPGNASATPNNDAQQQSSGTTNNTSNTTQQRPGITTTAQRPGSRGNTVLDDPLPGGNPDVPFDDNMNLGFLAVGVVFAFVIIRKRLMNKPITVSK